MVPYHALVLQANAVLRAILLYRFCLSLECIKGLLQTEFTLAMSAQAFLWTLCCSTSAFSSSSVQAPFWMSGRSSWFQRSRSCLPMRPLKYGTSLDHDPSPYVSTSLEGQSSL